MTIALPTIDELMGEGPFPSAMEYVLRRLRKGIFAPWLPVGANGAVDRQSCKVLFSDWEARKLVQRTRDQNLHPLPPAAMALQGQHIYGGADSLVEGDLYEPVLLGVGVTVRKKATVGRCCIVGDGVEVRTAHVARTVLFPGAKIASLAVVGDSIIGPGSKIESGVSLRSQTGHRNGPGTIVITDFRDPGQPEIDTGRTMLGTICGRNCLIEATVEPGCVFLPGCHVRAHMAGLESGIYSPELLDYLHEQHELSQRQHLRDAAAVTRRKA